MQKKIVNLKINDYEITTNGFLNNEILSFNDNDELKTNIIYDFKNDLLIRDNKDITIKIKFKEEKDNVEFFLKNENITFNNNLDEFKLLKEATRVIIYYKIEENQFNLEISYKEEEK